MRKKPLLFLGAVLAAVTLIASGCAEEGGGGQAAGCSSESILALGASTSLLGNDFKLASNQVVAQAEKTFKIGFIGDLTGGNASLITSSHDSSKLAVKTANDAGDLPFTLEFFPIDNKDAGKDPAPTRGLVQQFIDDPEVLGVVGPGFSGETDVGGKPLNDAGLTFITPSATRPDLTEKGWSAFFRALGNDFSQGGQTGDLLQTMGCEDIAVVNDKSPYGAGLSEAVVKSIGDAGGTVVLNEGIEPVTDYTSIVDSLIAEDHDAVYYAGYESEAPLLLKQYRERGGEGLFIGGDGVKGDKFLEEGGEDAEGAVVTCPCLDPTESDSQAAKDFVAAYNEEYDTDPGIYSAESWDSTNILIDAIKDGGANATRESVLEFVTNLDGYEGVSKTFGWTDTHEVAGAVDTYAYVVEDGAYTQVGKISDIAADSD